MCFVKVKMILPALTEAKSPFFRPIKYSLFPPLGLATLAGLGFVPRDGLFPIPVRLMAGGGVSNSFRGVIILYQIHRNEAPTAISTVRRPGAFM